MNAMEDSTEKTFYRDDSVVVTQARFVANGKTYAMRNISSVSLMKKARSRLFEFICFFIGALLLFSTNTLLFGVILILLGLALLFLLKDEYSVRIQSNSGEADGFISKNKDYVGKVVAAVNEAIVFRG
jgi:hypothetical protein